MSYNIRKWTNFQPPAADDRLAHGVIMATSSCDKEARHHGSKRKRDLLLCGHCNNYVSKSTYYRHRDAFFDPVLEKWERENPLLESNVQENETLSDMPVHMNDSEIDAERSKKNYVPAVCRPYTDVCLLYKKLVFICSLPLGIYGYSRPF